MNLRRIPVVATLLVLIAAGVMVRLGFWQLDRMRQKDALLAVYSKNLRQTADPNALLANPFERQANWYRHVHFPCRTQGLTVPKAGHSLRGETGWAHWAQCWRSDMMFVEVNLGWSVSPQPLHFDGAEIDGIIAPDYLKMPRVVADKPLAGLQPSAHPNPNDIPNNHLAYAIQWFLFAATALAIYALALRKRLAADDSRG